MSLTVIKYSSLGSLALSYSRFLERSLLRVVGVMEMYGDEVLFSKTLNGDFKQCTANVQKIVFVNRCKQYFWPVLGDRKEKAVGVF